MSKQSLSKLIRRMAIGTLAIFGASTITLIASQSPIKATPSAILFYSWGQGTNAVSQIAGGTNTAPWASNSTGTGAATGVAADDSYVYWANGQKVYRQSRSAASGDSSVAAFVNITGWSLNSVVAQRTIRAIAVDDDHIYIMGSRGYDGTSVLRASKTTGLQDTTWFWELGGGREGYGLTADNSPTGAVFAQWGNGIAKATKASTSNVPSTIVNSWSNANVANNVSGSEPVPLTNDGTYIYWRNTVNGVNRALMSSSSMTPLGGEGVVLSIPAGNIRGLSMNTSTGALYFDSSTGSSNTYTIYSAIPDVNTPPTPSAFATFSSTSGSLNALVSVPTPASAPTIVTQPAATSVVLGQTTSISVSATSSDGGTLSYQWRKDGVAISGATSALYTITNATSNAAGSYSVVVTNTLGSSTASTTSNAAVLTTTQLTTTTTTVPASSGVTVEAPTLVTSSNQAALEAAPGEAVAIINGQTVAVETVKVEANATPTAMLEAAKEIVAEITKLIPAGASNDIKVVKTDQGAELTGLMINPDDPKEKLNVPVESVTLVKAGNSAVLISALNQTNLPAEVVAGGEIQVTRGGLVAARAYGLPGSESGEIVLMSTPRLLQKFTVSANGTYNGQVPLPKNISFGSHTVVMATANAKVSLGIKLVRTKMQFRIKRVIATNIFKNRAGVKKAGGKVTITGAGRCKASLTKVTMSTKPGRCFITVKQAAKGAYPAVFYRFTVQVVTKLTKKK